MGPLPRWLSKIVLLFADRLGLPRLALPGLALPRNEQEARRRGDQRRIPELGSGQLDRRGQASMVRKQLVQFILR